jgi:hypothetical protein
VSDILKASELSRVELVERLNDLSRAGLTVQALDDERVEATPLALGFLSLVGAVSAQVLAQAQNDYLINPNAPIPPPTIHSRRINGQSKI